MLAKLANVLFSRWSRAITSASTRSNTPTSSTRIQTTYQTSRFCIGRAPCDQLSSCLLLKARSLVLSHSDLVYNAGARASNPGQLVGLWRGGGALTSTKEPADPTRSAGSSAQKITSSAVRLLVELELLGIN